jgi:hypothetical protein
MYLLEWNVNGIRSRLPDLRALFQHRDPAIICLQETSVHPFNALNLRGFTAHRCDHQNVETASGVTAVDVKDYINSIPVSLCSPLQVLLYAYTYLPSICFTLCNTCLSPSVPVSSADLSNLIRTTVTATINSCRFQCQEHSVWCSSFWRNTTTSAVCLL